MSQPSSKNLLNQSRNFILGTISLLTGIISFAILFRENLQLVTVAVAGLLLALVWLSCYYVTFTKTQRKPRKHKFPRARFGGIVGLIVIPILAITLLTLKPSQSYIQTAFYGTSTPPPTPTIVPLPPSIETVLIGETQDDYIIQATVLNPLDQDLLTTQINLHQTNYGNGHCYAPEIYIYRLLDNVEITTSPNDELELAGGVEMQSNPLSGYTFQAVGRIREDACSGSTELELGFPTSITLPANGYTSIATIIPKQFNMIADQTLGAAIEEIPLRRSPLFSLGRTSGGIVEFSLEIHTNGQPKMTYTTVL